MRHPNRVLGSHPDPYTTYPNQRFPLGQVMELPDGRIYRFAEVGAAALAASKLCSGMAMTANFDTLAVQTATVVGDTTIKFTNGTTSLVENELAEGTILQEDVALSLGSIYPIKSSTAGGSAATITATLADGVTVQEAVSTSGKVTVRVNPWKQVIIQGSPPLQLVTGIPQVVIGLTQYGWLQTHGVTNCLIDGSVLVIGQGVRPSELIDGAVTFLDFTEATQADLGLIGFALVGDDTSDTMFEPIFLKLD